MRAGDVLKMEPLGLRVEFLRTAEETGGELLEAEVTGRPRGLLAQRHIHPRQLERLEVIEGTMKVAMNGREHILGPGQSIEVPAGTPHTQEPVGSGPGRIRISVRPAGRTEGFLERLAELCREGQIMRAGFPRPVAGAALVLDFSDAGHAATPSVRVQRSVARTVLALARLPRAYRFVDEWDVAAPPRRDRRLALVPALVAAGLPRRRGGRAGRAGHGGAPSFQGPAALPPAHPLGDRRHRPAAPGGGRGRR